MELLAQRKSDLLMQMQQPTSPHEQQQQQQFEQQVWPFPPLRRALSSFTSSFFFFYLALALPLPRALSSSFSSPLANFPIAVVLCYVCLCSSSSCLPPPAPAMFFSPSVLLHSVSLVRSYFRLILSPSPSPTTISNAPSTPLFNLSL